MSIEPDDGRLRSGEPYEIIDNPVVGQQYRLLERGSDADGEFLRLEVRYRADAKHFAEHVHPRQAESNHVLSGEMVVTVAGEERTVGPGERVTLPAGVPHSHRNASGIETRVLAELRPPMAWVPFARALAGLAREGKTDEDGMPNPLALAVLLNAYPDIVYLPAIPIAVQKLLFGLLAPVGRLRGYSTDYPAVRGPGSE
jgi:mannose-6-phosphate isomerase-like protein (cupin superfamily)